jgi:hypothetical protein
MASASAGDEVTDRSVARSTDPYEPLLWFMRGMMATVGRTR